LVSTLCTWVGRLFPYIDSIPNEGFFLTCFFASRDLYVVSLRDNKGWFKLLQVIWAKYLLMLMNSGSPLNCPITYYLSKGSQGILLITLRQPSNLQRKLFRQACWLKVFVWKAKKICQMNWRYWVVLAMFMLDELKVLRWTNMAKIISCYAACSC